MRRIIRVVKCSSTASRGIAHSAQSVPKGTPRTVYVYAAGSDNACVTCKKESHQMNTCSKFQGMSSNEKLAVVKRSGYCMNCPGQMASKCHPNPACGKSSNAHHTLLRIDTSSTWNNLQWKRSAPLLTFLSKRKETGSINDVSSEDHWT